MSGWGSNRIYLQINNDVLPVEPGKGYTINLGDYEQIDKTEAGTTVRNLTRTGIPSISVKLSCNKQMLQNLRNLKKSLSLDVKYYDPDKDTDENGNNLANNLMYMTGYSEKMLADTKDGGIWDVSFSLEDLEDV